MNKANFVLVVVAIVVFAIGYFSGRASIPKISGVSEGFDPSILTQPVGTEVGIEDETIEGFDESCPDKNECIPDSDKYVLRSSIPPCPAQINMDKYMLKSECPALPDMSKYVLKSSVPKCQPCICANPKPARIGACPPCPRQPVLECAPCPPVNKVCPEVKVSACPSAKINCKADYIPENAVKPSLASMSAFGF